MTLSEHGIAPTRYVRPAAQPPGHGGGGTHRGGWSRGAQTHPPQVGRHLRYVVPIDAIGGGAYQGAGGTDPATCSMDEGDQIHDSAAARPD